MRNPYSADRFDENALRRNALLEALDEPTETRDRTRPSTPEPVEFEPNRPGVARPYARPTTVPDPSRASLTLQNPYATATINDPAPAPEPASPAPTGPDLGNQPAAARDAELENELIDQYMGSFTPRGGYGGLEPTRKAISMGLLQSGEPYSMVSGAFGMLDAWMRRRAESAPTDYNIDDVRIGLQNAYRDMFGFDIDPAELDKVMQGQGYQPENNDRYGGRDGLGYILNQWYHQSAPDRAAREGQAAAGDAPATTPAAGAPATAAGGLGQFAGNLEGFNMARFGDPSGQGNNTVKYQVGRVLSKYQPDANGLAQAVEELRANGFDVQQGGSKGDLLVFGPGVEQDGQVIGTIDVGRGFGAAGSGWAWQPQGGAEGGTGGGLQRSGATRAQDAYQALTGMVDPGSSREEMEAAIEAAFGDVPGYGGAYKESVMLNGQWYDLVSSFGGQGAAWQGLTPKGNSGSSTGSSMAGISSPSSGLSSLAPGVSLAPALGQSDALQRIMDEIRRIQSGAPPRDALLAELGG